MAIKITEHDILTDKNKKHQQKHISNSSFSPQNKDNQKKHGFLFDNAATKAKHIV
jgi:hypothetical protein